MIEVQYVDPATEDQDHTAVSIVTPNGTMHIVDSVIATLTAFKLLWPHTFSNPPKPLKIGIHKDLFEKLPGISHRRIRLALAEWCSRPEYRYAMKIGATRCDLAGRCLPMDFVIDNPVTPEAARRAERNKNWGRP